MKKSVPGEVYTFYSYKGGTGRSMALANTACLLSERVQNGERVLMIDWDLEAPGLHRFFEGNLKKVTKSTGLEKQLGLIDFFVKVREASDVNGKRKIPDNIFEKLHIEKYVTKTNIDNLYLMTAGRFDDFYPTRVNTFNWEDLFNKNPWLISDFANYLTRKYRYILIDSRTGFTDISSVCTAIMPEKLIVVFTPNRQSLTGVLHLIKTATSYRRNSDDLRPLVVFPLASRIENAESDLQKDWRFGSKQKNISGYQPEFETILSQVYNLPSINLTDYFDDIQIQYIPRYSYGEEIAVLSDRSEERLSIARSYESFTDALVSINAPWEYRSKSAIKISEDKTSSNIYISGSYSQGTVLGDVAGADIISKVRSESKLRVFLSHASTDKSIVREFYQRLLSEGWIDPWLDEEQLLPGQDWDMEIEKAVHAAHAVIVFLSNKSVTKEGYIQKELRLTLDVALEKNEGQIFILPIRLDECDVPRRLRSWQYVDSFPKERRERAYKLLIESLRIRYDSLKQPSPK